MRWLVSHHLPAGCVHALAPQASLHAPQASLRAGHASPHAWKMEHGVQLGKEACISHSWRKKGESAPLTTAPGKLRRASS